MITPCPLCERFADPESPLVIVRSRRAVLSHMPGVDLPGYLLLSPLRHVEDAGALDREEERELAGLQSRAVREVLALPEVRKVYILSFGEAVPHLHLHLFPRTEAMGRDPELQSPGAPAAGAPDGPKIFDHFRQRLAVPGIPDRVRALVLRLRSHFGEEDF
jgi:diadenosine tetraphosphate (Ap4A) HIT family hydrolase